MEMNKILTANYYPLDVLSENKFRSKLKNLVGLAILMKLKSYLSFISEEKQ
jgi:hypothetical protein